MWRNDGILLLVENRSTQRKYRPGSHFILKNLHGLACDRTWASAVIQQRLTACIVKGKEISIVSFVKKYKRYKPSLDYVKMEAASSTETL